MPFKGVFMPSFVSFNINSIRTRIHQLQAIQSTLAPDVIGLQETKVHDEAFPWADIENLGYHAEIFGQKSHYGVALLSKQKPIFVQKGFLADDMTSQRRFIHARYVFDGKAFDVLNGYFPQGENESHPTKFPLKRQFYADLTAYIGTLLAQNRTLIVMGDMNVAPEDIDVGIGASNAKRWLKNGTCSFLPIEREWYQSLLATGLFDSYRHIYPDGDELSWFDYRSKGFDDTPKRGLRIDHILLSPDLAGQVISAGISYEVRAMDKPSDHAPVWVSLKS